MNWKVCQTWGKVEEGGNCVDKRCVSIRLANHRTERYIDLCESMPLNGIECIEIVEISVLAAVITP